ncbi:hypothetical protein RB5001 [Rhodopirellula baltica SH 1]|uniref:Uncharacterized protein n=1 Tax=Rhodopirellula baltica (strain DSM 10527 / NCIMB 13988 / SH1) TaxID=243090 RepID=Q7UGU8_RHOBA|nr:hypothetical protein RB5001 [Rhodopirellula baltica SH 1]
MKGPTFLQLLNRYPHVTYNLFEECHFAFGPKCANSHPPKRSASQKDNARLTSDSGWPGQELDGGRRRSTWFETIRHGERFTLAMGAEGNVSCHTNCLTRRKTT